MPLWANYFRADLNTSISSATGMTGAGTIVIDAPAAPIADPPDPAGERAWVIIADALPPSMTKYEVFYYTGITDNGSTIDLTGVTRAQEGTSAQDFDAAAVVFQDLTAEFLEYYTARSWAALGVLTPRDVL